MDHLYDIINKNIRWDGSGAYLSITVAAKKIDKNLGTPEMSNWITIPFNDIPSISTVHDRRLSDGENL